jgi:nucleotide-binding universal stress UspA family protein
VTRLSNDAHEKAVPSPVIARRTRRRRDCEDVMFTRPVVLCPTDYSEPSRGALRYASALGEHFYAELIVLTVEEPFRAEAAVTGADSQFPERQTRAALSAFVNDTFGSRRPQLPALREQIATGHPAEEILRCAAETKADVIVMSTRGTTGLRKMVFGSITERVLRNTQTPVLVTPAADPGPDSVEAWKQSVRRVLVPVDFSDWMPRQIRVACGLAAALDSELLFAHVLPTNAGASRAEVHDKLDALIHSAPARYRPAMAIGRGDAGTEIARIAGVRGASLIVVGLHSSPERRQHMGRVTYALLCQAPVLVLALPPAGRAESGFDERAFERQGLAC